MRLAEEFFLRTIQNVPNMKEVDPIEQLRIDRMLFEATLAAQAHAQAERVPTQRVYGLDEARMVLDHIATQDHYTWVKRGLELELLAALMNDIAVFREEYATKHGQPPTSRQVYRKFRHAHELGEIPVDVINALDAMMGGNPRDGELVDFDAIVQTARA